MATEVITPQEANNKTTGLEGVDDTINNETDEQEQAPEGEILPTKRRAIRTAVLGMIWNANHVLEDALHPKTKNVPQKLFQKCHGIVLLTMTKAGFLVTGHVGTGVMMVKQNMDDENAEAIWSPPVAVYNGGYSIGAVMGKKNDNMLIFLMDEKSVKDFAKRPQTRIGVTAALTVAKHGGEANQGNNTTFEGKNSITVCLTNGAFTGVSLEMGTLEAVRFDDQLEAFYGKRATPAQILFEKGFVTPPPDSMVSDMHDKLRMLARGETWEPSFLDASRSSQVYQKAEQIEGRK